MLIVQVVSIHTETAKNQYFRRLSHCATLLAKGVADSDTSRNLKRYMERSDFSEIAGLASSIGARDPHALEAIFESASTYTTVENSLLAGDFGVFKTLSNGYLLLEHLCQGDESTNGNRMTGDRVFSTHNHNLPISIYLFESLFTGSSRWGTYAREKCADAYHVDFDDIDDALNKMGHPYYMDAEDYIKFLRNHSATFRIELDFEKYMTLSIDDILNFPIPVL
jgi:hypothetical protein